MQMAKVLPPVQKQISRNFSDKTSFIQKQRVYPKTSLIKKQPIYRTVDEVLNYKGLAYRIYPHKVFYKLLFRDKHKKGFFAHPPVGQPSINIRTVAECTGNARTASSTRILILNKLFMRYITEILSTSEIAEKLFGHDIQISHVKMSADFSCLKVYWIPKGTEEDDKIQRLLDEIVSSLRSELIKLRIMGMVPPIHFKKDKFHAIMAEVDRRLKIADFGKDYVPTMFTENSLQRQLQLIAPVSEKLKKNISSLEKEFQFTEDEEQELPSMGMNTFGLDYEKILSSVTNGMKKIRVLQLASKTEESILGTSAIKEVSFNIEAQQKSQSWDKAAFLSFLKKEKYKRKKMLKEQSKELKKKLLESSLAEEADDAEDELYIEFVKNAFEDHIDSNDENLEKSECRQ